MDNKQRRERIVEINSLLSKIQKDINTIIEKMDKLNQEKRDLENSLLEK